MPVIDQTFGRKKAVRRKPKPAQPTVPDQADRAVQPTAAPTKTRLYAHPQRPNPQKAMREEAARQQAATQHRAAVKRAVKRIHTTPVPSPDATDSKRSPAQKAHDAAVAAESVRASRVKALRKEGRGSGTRAVKAELEGRGKIAAFLDSLGTKAVRGNAEHYGGPGFAAIQAHSATSSIPGKIVKDVINLPAQVVPSLYVPVAGGYEAAKGRPQRIKKFASDLDKSDPVYNLGAAAVDAVGGDSKGAKGRLAAAKKAASEHPGFTAAEALGVKGAVGRGAGAVMRHGPSKTARRVASTERAARTLPGTSLREDRSYSPDVIRKAGQVTAEKVRRKVATKVRKRADSFKKDVPDHAAELNRLADKIDVPQHISEQEIQKRVDDHVDAQEAVRRQHRGDVLNETRALVKDAHGAGPLTNLVAQGIVHADVQDIKAYVRELEAEYPHLSNAGKRANKQLRKGMEAALARSQKGKVDLKGLEDVAAKYRSSQAAREADLAAREMLPEQQAAKAAAIPYATRRMEAEHTNAHRVEAADRAKESLDHVRSRVKGLERQKTQRAAVSRVKRGQEVAAGENPHRTPPPPEAQFTHVVRDTATSAKAKLERIREEGIKPSSNGRVYAWGPGHVDRAADFGKHGDATHLVIDARGLRAHGGEDAPTRTLDGPIPTDRLWVRGKDGKLTQLVKIAASSKEAARVGEANRIDRALTAARVELHKAEAAHSAARKVRNEAELVGKDGKPLSLDEIRQHMEDNGEPIPSWLSQAPNARGAHNFFQPSSRAPGIHGEARTGKATKGGTFDAHPDTLTEGAAKQQGLIDAFDGFHSFLDEFGIKGTGGRIKTLHTRKQVEEATRNAMFDEHGELRPGAVKFVAVRVNPFGGRAEQLGKMLEGTDDASLHGAKALNEAIDEALKGGGDGPWALVPEAAAKRLQEHVRVLNPGNLGKVGQKGNSLFRTAVLSTSLPWLTGNIVEGGMRAALAGAGPRSLVTGHRVLKRARELDKVKGERSTARTVGGGHFGSVERQQVHMNVDAMNPGKVKGIARALGTFWRYPGPKHVAAAWHGYTHLVFNTVNRAIETQIQTAMLGKSLHHSDLMDAPLRKASEAAIDKAAHGILDQNTAAAFGRQIDIMYGKYGKWSPDMRKMVALYTPFVAWTLNATYFVTRTLPRDHPVALALIASAENATDEWRKAHGLDKFIKGAAPLWLQGSIPGPGGTHFRAPTRYTPFSVGSDFLGTWAAAVLPQLSTLQMAGKALDWQGHPIADTDASKSKAILNAVLDGSVPAIALGRRVADKGVKGATLDATLGKVAPAKKKARRSSSSGAKAGQIVGPGSGSGGRIIGPGSGSGSGGRIIR